MERQAPHAANADQTTYWNGVGGRRWTDRQETQDAVLAPASESLFRFAGISAGQYVLDIGCGCGTTTLQIASRIGPQGSAIGIDVSAPMLARARELTPPGAPVRFVEADATIHDFEPGRADLIFSRFGVMFFGEPERSFVNMRKGLRAGGRLVFACWREPRFNPWMMTPLQAVYRHAPRLPEVGPEDPGAFSFANQDRVARILNAAGFSSIAMHPVDLVLDVAVGMGLDAAVESVLEIGPASRALEGQPAETVSAAAGAVRTALAEHLKGQSVPMAAAIWIVTASSR